ncbi:MAG: type II toxin-antitoxin system RelE family toxin [Gammaproteobacteria bacterium]
MSYQLTFLKSAKKEWDKLPPSLKEQFKKKLAVCLVNPKNPKNQLSGMKDCYKIKLRDSGYRLVYRVIQERIVVKVVAVGKREKNAIYKAAMMRVNEKQYIEIV